MSAPDVVLDPALDQLLTQWHAKVASIAAIDVERDPLVAEERALRAKIVSLLFPLMTRECLEFMNEHDTDEHRPDCKCGREGVNYFPLPKEHRLKGTVVVERKVDESSVDACKVELQKMLINPDTIFRYKPELQVKAYKELPAAARKVVDTTLIIKPGSPKLEVVPPKEKA